LPTSRKKSRNLPFEFVEDELLMLRAGWREKKTSSRKVRSMTTPSEEGTSLAPTG
jgi:hypothetical protein